MCRHEQGGGYFCIRLDSIALNSKVLIKKKSNAPLTAGCNEIKILFSLILNNADMSYIFIS